MFSTFSQVQAEISLGLKRRRWREQFSEVPVIALRKQIKLP